MIKKLNKKNVEGIMTLHKDSIFPLWNKLDRDYSAEEIETFVKRVFDKGEVHGYFLGKNFVGVIGIELRGDKCEIVFLLVDPREQGKGIGNELMNFIETKFKDKVKSFFLEVLVKNLAVDFYKKRRYKIKKEKNEKYVMEKQL